MAKCGDLYEDDIGIVEVKAVFDGYIAFRRNRCAMALLKDYEFFMKFSKYVGHNENLQ